MRIVEEEVGKLKKLILEMAAFAEDLISKSIQALKENNMILAEEIIKMGGKIDEMEIKIDNLAIKILALQHPEAQDLRTVTMIMKINNDLERIGDHAENIAEKVLFLADKPPVKPLIDIPRMGEMATAMLKDGLDAFVNKNDLLAVEVCKRDDEVDSMEDQIVRELLTYMISDPTTIDRGMVLILIARSLERVADLATNIAEDAYYIAKGVVLKHHAIDK
ncbi:MAG: phosphate signaling complex protein PhoU [Thermodesulfobacteriota bacterium]